MSQSKNATSGDASSEEAKPTCYDGKDEPSPEYPVLTQAEFEDRDYQVISGTYFTEEGRYLPLSNRPATCTQGTVLKNHPTVIDVTICGFSTFVTVTDLSEKAEIEQKLKNATDEHLDEVIDKAGTYCTHPATSYILIFSPKGY